MDKTEKALRLLLHSLMHTAQSRHFSDVPIHVQTNFINKVEQIFDVLDSDEKVTPPTK